jgi:hypothetical protein
MEMDRDIRTLVTSYGQFIPNNTIVTREQAAGVLGRLGINNDADLKQALTDAKQNVHKAASDAPGNAATAKMLLLAAVATIAVVMLD